MHGRYLQETQVARIRNTSDDVVDQINAVTVASIISSTRDHTATTFRPGLSTQEVCRCEIKVSPTKVGPQVAVADINVRVRPTWTFGGRSFSLVE